MTPPTTTTALPTVGRYRIDPSRTTIRFHTRHLFGLGSVSGTVRLRQADLTVAAPPASTTVRARLSAASFDTGLSKRDAAVRSAKFLDVTAYPDITFDSQQIHQHQGAWVADGTLTAHGIAAPVTLTLDELHHDSGGQLHLRASARIDRYAHQVTAGKGLAARRLTAEIDATATPANTDD